MRDESLPNTGLTCDDTTTCEPFRPLKIGTHSVPGDTPTSFAEDSPARTLARPGTSKENAPASTANAPGCGASLPESLASYDLDSSLWKTSQSWLFEDWGELPEAWPRSGMTVNGTAYPLPPLVPTISGTGCSYLPTPSASGFGCRDVPRLLERRRRTQQRTGNGNGFGLTLTQWVRLMEWQATGQTIPGSLNPVWVEWLMGFPLGWTETDALEIASSHK